MIKKLTHNWQWKLLSLVISVVFWVMIVITDDPYIYKSFDDIPVIKNNEEAITSQNYAIEYLEGETVDLIIKGKRTIMDKFTSEDITAYADLSRVSYTNVVDIKIDAGEDVEVTKKNPNEMVIATEQIKSILMGVQVQYKGVLADDHIPLTADVQPNQIEITGPESKLGLISSVIVPVNIDEADEDISVYVTPQVLNSSGDEVKGLELSNNQIQVNLPIQLKKTIPVSVTTVGSLNENYRLISMKIQTTSVTIRGEDEDLVNINRLLVDDIDLSNLTDADTSLSVNLADYLPENVYIYDPGAMTTVTVDIEPIINSSYIINQEDINVKQIPEGLQFKFVDEEPYVIGMKGIYEDLNDLKVEEMLPRITLTDLAVGVHDIQLELTIPSEFELSSELPVVRVELTESITDEEETSDTMDQSGSEEETSDTAGGSTEN